MTAVVFGSNNYLDVYETWIYIAESLFQSVMKKTSTPHFWTSPKEMMSQAGLSFDSLRARSSSVGFYICTPSTWFKIMCIIGSSTISQFIQFIQLRTSQKPCLAMYLFVWSTIGMGFELSNILSKNFAYLYTSNIYIYIYKIQNARCMEYLPKFTQKLTQVQVNIPYMEHMVICSRTIL